jgi:hypothetical protein
MVSVDIAQQLREAGIRWTPGERDTFMVPGTGLEQKVFVISELAALVQPLAGVQHITFHGSSEWALDHVMVRDAVWLPSETQLRLELESRLPSPTYTLEHGPSGYRCVVPGLAADDRFYPSAEDAYAAALLRLLHASGGETSP